jgi:hypothetical protein
MVKISDGIPHFIRKTSLKKMSLAYPSRTQHSLATQKTEGGLTFMKKWYVSILTGLFTILSTLATLAETTQWG